jgi:hypothetical protein
VIKKIVYIHETFYRNNRDLGIELMEKKGYKIELWSLYKIKYHGKLNIPRDVSNREVVYLKNHFEILNRLRNENLSDTIFFFTTTTHRGGIEDFIRIAVCLNGGRYANFIYEIVPVGPINRKNKEALKSKIANFLNARKYKVYQIMKEKWCQPTYCFVPTTYSAQNLLLPFEKAKKIAVHNKDYDEYIMKKNDGSNEPTPYVVYIDGDMVDAEDFRKNNSDRIYKNPDIFYKNIRRLFDVIEDHYKCKVIIAAHPKSEYKGNEFGERKIVYFQTDELVRDALLVITHASCAINFVVLYRKDYIFLVDKYIRKSFIWNYLTLPMIKELRANTYDFGSSKGDPWDFINHPNEDYDRYYKRFINETDNESKLFYQIVEEKIRVL